MPQSAHAPFKTNDKKHCCCWFLKCLDLGIVLDPDLNSFLEGVAVRVLAEDTPSGILFHSRMGRMRAGVCSSWGEAGGGWVVLW